jgi:hypothetical protein
MADPVTANKIDLQVGFPTDAANPAGSLHAKVEDLKSAAVLKIAPSATLQLSADTERTTQSITGVLVKSIAVNHSGSLQVSFDIHSNNGGATATAYVSINGGSNTVLSSSSNSIGYVTYTGNVGVHAGDTMQLYLEITSATYIAYVRNFRLSFDFTTTNGLVITN